MSAVAHTELVADAYRSASLAGAQMRLATQMLESVREKLRVPAELAGAELAAALADQGFGALELLERQIAAIDDPDLADVLVKLRVELRRVLQDDDLARIRTSLARDASAGWRTWRHAFGTALGYFRMRHCLFLAEELARLLQERPGGDALVPPDDVTATSAAARFLANEDWAQTYDVFMRVGVWEEVETRHRCKALLSAAQVQIYFRKDFEVAQHHIDAARLLSPDGRVATVQGELRLQQGQRDEARKCYEEAVRLSPELADGYLAIAELLLSNPAGAPGTSIATTEPSRILDDDHKRGALDSAEQWCRQALQCVGGLRSYSILIRITIGRLGVAPSPEVERRVHELQARAVRADPEDRLNILFTAGEKYTEARSYETALQYFDELVREPPPKRMDFLVWRGMIHHQLRQYEQARSDLVEALAAPGSPAEAARPELERMAMALVKEKRDLSSGQALLAEIRRVLGDAYEPTFQAKQQELRKQLSLSINSDANKAFSAGQYAASIALYLQALELFIDPVYYANLARAWQHHPTASPMEVVEQALTAIRRAAELSSEDAEYREMVARLERERELVERFPLSPVRPPIVQPITVEVGAGIGRLFEGQSSSALAEVPARLIQELRDEIFKRLGTRIPGVRIRMNESDLPDSTYIIMLSEVPIVSGTLALEHLWALAPVERLQKLGIAAEEVINPANGAETSWIAVSARDTATAASITVLPPLQHLLVHLSYIIERNLAELVGLQEVHALLQGKNLLPAEGATSGVLTAFTGVLRGLLVERVPIGELAALWTGFSASWKRGVRLVEIVEELRKLPVIRPQLPGNDADRRFVLSQQLAEVVRRSIYRSDEVPVLAMEPTVCQDALTAIRNAVNGAVSAALVCPGDVRPFLRKLVELEFPELPVICDSELLKPLDDSALRISIEGES